MFTARTGASPGHGNCYQILVYDAATIANVFLDYPTRKWTLALLLKLLDSDDNSGVAAVIQKLLKVAGQSLTWTEQNDSEQVVIFVYVLTDTFE